MNFNGTNTGTFTITNIVSSPNITGASGCLKFRVKFDSDFIFQSYSTLSLTIGTVFTTSYYCSIYDDKNISFLYDKCTISGSTLTICPTSTIVSSSIINVLLCDVIMPIDGEGIYGALTTNNLNVREIL